MDNFWVDLLNSSNFLQKVTAAETVKIGCMFLSRHIGINSKSTICNILMFDNALAIFSVLFSISVRTCFVSFF